MTLLTTLAQADDASGGSVLARYSFDTPAGNANGYISEIGNKALSVWSGAANVAGGFLQSNTTAVMRAKFNAGVVPGYWKGVFKTPAVITSAEFYVDFRDNGTNRVSAAADGTHFYIFDGYTATTLAQTGMTLDPNSIYTIEVLDTPALTTALLHSTLWELRHDILVPSGGSGTSGGVTTVAQITQIDLLEVRV